MCQCMWQPDRRKHTRCFTGRPLWVVRIHKFHAAESLTLVLFANASIHTRRLRYRFHSSHPLHHSFCTAGCARFRTVPNFFRNEFHRRWIYVSYIARVNKRFALFIFLLLCKCAQCWNVSVGGAVCGKVLIPFQFTKLLFWQLETRKYRYLCEIRL